MSIYVEIDIHGAMVALWERTQTPDLHARWDLRFTDIEYLPRTDGDEAQQFLYATRIGFGLAIEGRGETVGERAGATGQRTSALKFWSADPRSLICEGAGYWRYVPTADGLRFITSYDYRTRFGVIGRVVDSLVFRPLLGWATAWSFDRLRLWLEKDIDPDVSLRNSLIHLLSRGAIAFVWVYQGLAPKLLASHADELTMMQQAGVSASLAVPVAQAVGAAEVLFGLAMLYWFHARWHFVATLVLMLWATFGVAVNSPQFLTAAFNPISLNVLMAVLSSIGLMVGRELPSARRCLRKPRAERT